MVNRNETPDEAVGRFMAAAAKKAAGDIGQAYEAALAAGHQGSVLDLVENVFVRELAAHFGAEYTQRRAPFRD